MKIPLTAKRVFKNADQIIFDIKGFKTSVRIKLEKSSYAIDVVCRAESGDEQAIMALKTILLTQIYSDMEVEVI